MMRSLLSHRRTFLSPRAQHKGRRAGVLLLIVLSMLTLFMMLGATYLVAASRARLAARAYSRLTFMGDDARIPYDRVADSVLMTVLRGGPTVSSGTSTVGVLFESILADKYGPPSNTISGSATIISGSGPVVVVSATLLSGSAQPTDLNGRILSFVGPGDRVTSHRILRAWPWPATGSVSNVPATAFGLALDAIQPSSAFVPPTGSTRVVINGREFAGAPATSATAPPANESWDGFDFHNPFLSQVAPGTTISSSTVSQISYASNGPLFTPFSSGTLVNALTTSAFPYDFDGDGICDIADNDADGVPDGLFLDFAIPDSTDGAGNRVKTRASVLVVDLDGRFNVNAHDSLPRLAYSGTTHWTGAVDTGSVPIGSGYGVGEIDGGKVLTTSTSVGLFQLTGGETAVMTGTRSAGSRYSLGEQTLRLSALEGKYGEQASTNWALLSDQLISTAFPSVYSRPGVPDTDDTASQIVDRRVADPTASPPTNYGIPPLWWTGTNAAAFNWGVAGTDYPLPRGIFNSPPDLHGRMRTLTLSSTTAGGVVPHLAFAQPEWSSGTLATDHHETRDDPYEFLIDTRTGLGGYLAHPSTSGTTSNLVSVARDNPFTPAELEAVLRPYDVDTNRHSPRLAAMLGAASEESRLKITTDSWDTTAITGSAALTLFGTAGGTSGWLQRIGPSVSIYSTVPTLSLAAGDLVANEVSRGHRFDLNRALAASESSNAGYPASLSNLVSEPYHYQRVNYFKDLYTLLVGLTQSGTTPLPLDQSRALAQWAANVVEFRDADSRVIPFEYDTDPLAGWEVDGWVSGTSLPSGAPEPRRRIVWGAERPEIVLQEVFAWHNTASGTSGMAITLHRPWNATAYASGSSSFIAAEPCDVTLDTLDSGTTGAPTNIVDLGKKASATAGSIPNPDYVDISGTTYPIWRLRITGTAGTTYLRLDTDTASAGEEYVLDTGTSSLTPAAKPRLAVDSSLTLFTGTAIPLGNPSAPPPVASGTATLSVSGSTVRIVGAAILSSGTIYLERLSDPTQPLSTGTATIPGTSVTGTTVWTGTSALDTTDIPVRYIVVDQCPFNSTETQVASPVATSNRRLASGSSAFWRSPSTTSTGTLGPLTNGVSINFPSSVSTGDTAWLPWPNRPFASPAELLMIPQGDSEAILRDYTKLNPSLSGTIAPPITGSVGSGFGPPIPLDPLLEAVDVPTRFRSIHITSTSAVVTTTTTGIDPTITTVNQLSSFREPGRVNLNTVVAADVWNAVVAGPLAAPVRTGSDAGYAMSGTAPPNPARSLYGLLTLHGGTTGTVVISDTASVTGTFSGPGFLPPLTFALNPQQQIYTATRLANTATPRSNVFAIWVTIRQSIDNDPDSVRYHRAFYIIDRSIPVAFEEGRDHNVLDCVRLRRIIQ
jgi:hypothetical protein